MTHDEIEGTLILEMHIIIQFFLLYIPTAPIGT
jgi:hypothetical protein